MKQTKENQKEKFKGFKLYVQIDEVDAAITECLDRKDINCRM